MKDIEIEIQAQVENEKPLIEFLEKEGKFQSEKNQIDEYFSPAHKDFLSTRPVNEWLRLRNAEGQGSINYKIGTAHQKAKAITATNTKLKLKISPQQKRFWLRSI